MEKWSRYNYLLNSDEIGKFLYNARTNSFTKLNEKLYLLLEAQEINDIPEYIKENLRSVKALVEENEDDNYYIKKKFAKYTRCFSMYQLNLTIATTTNCNLRCPYCYEANASKSNLNIDVCNQIIKFIEKNQAKELNITWYGGEPLLNFLVIRYLTEILGNNYKGKAVNYSIITNGSLLKKEYVDFFKKFNLSFMQITLDGLQESHDKTRVYPDGKGSFNQIIENLEYAIKELQNTHISIRVNVDSRNINEYPELYHFLKNRLGHTNLYIYNAFILDYYDKLSHCIPRHEKFGYDIKFSEEFDTRSPDTYPVFRLGGCGAELINSFVVDPNGRLCKCWMDVGIEDRVVGSVFPDDNVKFNYDLLSQYIINADMYNNEKCKNCFLFPVCGGGCAYYRMRQWNNLLCDIVPSDIDKYLVYHYHKLNIRK